MSKNIPMGVLGQSAGGGVGFQFFRLNISAGNIVPHCSTNEIRWVVGGVEYPTAVQTSATTPLTVTWSYAQGGRVGWYTYDGNNTSGGNWNWSLYSQGFGSVTIDMGEIINPSSCRIWPSTGLEGFAPKDFTLEASADGLWAGEEVVLSTQTGISDWTTNPYNEFFF